MIKYKCIRNNCFENILLNTPKFWSYFEDLAEKYQGFIFGIQGVLFDGINVFPAAIDCLEKLRVAEKTVSLISNTVQRSPLLVETLRAKGIPLSLYQYIVTAGDETYRHLRDKNDPWHNALGDTCYFIGSTEDHLLMEKLPYHHTNHIEEADFILVAGTDEWDKDLEDYFPDLDVGITLCLPLICANPDQYCYIGQEKFIFPGAFATYYQKKGGEVFYHGKPYISIFNQILKKLTVIKRDKILFIGDSLATDIMGANRIDLDSLLVCSPVTFEELTLPLNAQQILSLSEISEMIGADNPRPTHMMRSLKW